MSGSDWLKGLKVGDKVIMNGALFSPTVRTVERMTKTMIFLEDERVRYNRRSGYKVGAYAWDSSMITIYDPEVEAEINRKRELKTTVAYIQKHMHNIEKLPASALNEIKAVLEKVQT